MQTSDSLALSPAAPAVSPAQREQIYRHNFIVFLSDGILFTVAMRLIGASTVIPDFVRNLTDSEILIGLSGSLFHIGWTLPQLFVARYIVRYARKKWWFAGPNIPVRFVILLFAGVIVLLGPDQPGAMLAAFLIAYGIAAVGDGLVGVPWADLIASSLDNRWRARMFGLMTAAAGLIMLAVAPLIGWVLGPEGPGFPNNYAVLFGAAGVLFMISILPVLLIRELPGGKATETVPTLGEFLPDLGRVLRQDGPFRAMVITGVLTTLIVMANPFYVGFATVQLQLASEDVVPVLVAMETIGSVLGALVYTWLGAKHNLLYMRLSLALVILLPFSALLATVVGPLPLYAGYLISGMALSNLTFSYLNWVVGYATPERRPIYAGLFNTLGAVVTLIAPFIAGTIVQSLGYEVLFTVALVMAVAALFVTLRYLPNPRPQDSAAPAG